MRRLSLLVVAVMLFATGAFADNIIFDLSPTNGMTSRSGGSGVGQGVTVSTTTTVNDMEFYLDSPNGGNFKFMIWNGTNDSLLFLDTEHVNAIQSPTWVASPNFSFTLEAGNTYYFGVISDSSADYGYIFPPINYSNNGLTAVTTGNANYSGYGVPTFSGSGAAEIGLRLSQTAVPEPGSLVLLGTGLLGVMGAVRRRLL